jgi:hypothetical protein
MSIAKARDPRPSRLLDGFPPDTRIVVAGVTWEDYERFSRAVLEGDNCRVAFDGKDIELIVFGPFHESLRAIADALIAIVARELGIEHRPVGSTTWKRKNLKRGIESNVSYYFDTSKLAAFAAAFARRSNKIKDYPNPDLAVEIDISPSKIDRPGIYCSTARAGDMAVRDRIGGDRAAHARRNPCRGSIEPIPWALDARVDSLTLLL